MTRAGIRSLVVLAYAFSTAARAECLAFAPQVVTLTGTLEERSAHASRPDEKVMTNAKARGGLVLVLPEPVCVADEAAPNKKEEGISEVALVFGDKALRAYPRGVLRVTGTLSRSLVANGSPKVVLFVRRVTPAALASPPKTDQE